MSDDLKDEIKLVANADGVEAGVSRAKRSLATLGQAADQVGEQGAKGFGRLGAGSEDAGRRMDQTTKNMVSGLQRQIAALEAGGTATRQYQESIARLRGADLTALRPYLDQLDAAKAKAEGATRAQQGMEGSMGTLGNTAGFLRGQMVALVGSFTFAAGLAFVRQMADAVDALNDVKDATGASIENISALEDVAQRTGTTLDVVTNSMVKLNDVLNKAKPGSDQALALKAIGLEAEALKKLDPAEALRQVAVALSGYADDQNKARLVQELFGKSLREMAPFLADLAEKTALVGKVTTAQAAEAEKFNKQLFELRTNASDAGRALVSGMLPGLNQIAEAMSRGAKEGNLLLGIYRGLAEFAGIAFGTDKLGQQLKSAKDAQGEMVRLSNIMIGVQATLEREPENAGAQRRLETLRTKIEALQKQALEATDAIKGLVGAPVSAGGGRGSVNPDVVDPRASVVAPISAAENNAAAAAAKKAAEEQRRELQEQAKLFAELSGLSANYYEELAKAQKMRASGNFTDAQYVAFVEALIAKQPFAIAMAKEETEATKARVRAYQESAKAEEAALATRQRSAATGQQQVQRLRDEEQAAMMAASGSITLAQAVEQIALARLRDEEAKLRSQGADGATLLALQQEIEAREQIIDLIGSKAVRESNANAARKIADESARMADDINRSLTDALLRGFESGEGFAENFRNTLSNMFNTLVLRPVISAVLSPVTGMLSGLVGGGAGAAGGGGGLLNMLSMGKNAYSLYSGGLSGLTAPGSMYYNLATSSIGQGLGLSNAAPILGNNVSAFAPAGTQLTSPFSGGMSAAGGAGVFAAVVGIVLNALGAFKSERRIGGGLMGTLGQGDLQPWEEWREGGTLFSGPSFSTMNPVAELEARRAQLQALKDSGQGDTQQAATLQVIVDNLENLYGDLADQTKAQSNAIQAAYEALRTNVGDMADVLGLGSDAVRAFTTSLGADGKGLNFDGLSGDEISAKIAEALSTANNELARQVLGKFVTTTTTGTRIVSENVGSQGEDQNIVYSEVEQTSTNTRYVASEYAREGEEAIDTLTRLATSLATTNDIFDTLGVTLLEASLSGADAASALADAFGGLERMAALTQDYYQNYYSAEERKAKLQEDLNAQFAELGIDVPKTRDEFRKLVNDTLAQVEVDRSTREALGKTFSETLAASGGKFSIEDLGKTSIGALVLDGPRDPANDAALDKFLGGLNDLATQGLDPDKMQEGVLALIDTNAAMLGLDKDAAKTAATLLGLNGVFAELNESAEEATARIERERAKAQDEAYSNFRRAVERDRNLLNDQASGLQDVIGGIADAVSMLDGNARDLYASVASTSQMMAVQGMLYVEQALAGVRAGASVADFPGLSDAIDAARGGIDGGVYVSDFDRRRDALVLAGQVSDLRDDGKLELSVAERQLKGITDQLDALNLLADKAEAMVNGTAELTETVDTYFSLLLQLLAPPDVGDTRPERVGASGGAVFGGSNPNSGGTAAPQSKYKRPVSLGTGGVGYVGVSAEEEKRLDQFNSGYKAFDNTGDAAGLAAWIAENKLKPEDMSALSGLYATDWDKWYRENGIPAYKVGTNFVPEDGPAYLHKGEAVLPAAFNPWAGGVGMEAGGNAGVVAAVLRVEGRLAALEAHAAVTAANTSVLPGYVDQRDDVSEGGNADRVEIMNVGELASAIAKELETA